MICSSCQRNIADGSRFCYNCGAQQQGTGMPNTAAATGGPKKLMRSSADRKISGVCAGVADYFDLDPTLVRVLWLLMVVFGGFGLLLYLVLWIVLPVAPFPAAPSTPGAPSTATS